MGKEKEEMRDQIIKYLQGMQCKWFPVEWDSFAFNHLGVRQGYSEKQLDDFFIKYEFCEKKYLVRVSFKKNEDVIHFTNCYYFTLDRCKTLLLNAVRSVDEPRRRRAGINIEGNGHHSGYTIATGGELIQIYYHTKDGATIAWENGEFK